MSEAYITLQKRLREASSKSTSIRVENLHAVLQQAFDDGLLATPPVYSGKGEVTVQLVPEIRAVNITIEFP